MVVESTPMGEGADKDLLGRLQEGMTVVDANGNDIGKVGYIQMEDPNAATIEPGVDQSSRDDRTGFIGGALFTGGDDDNVTDRMRHTGYFKLDSKGLFSSDKYITPEMVAGFSEGTVRLKYDKDDIPDPA